MKQLTVFEMEAISGGYNWDFSSFGAGLQTLVSNSVEAIGSAVVGGIITGAIGTLIGGTQSGANGGILGLGLLGNLVGMFWGLGMGAIGGAVGAAAVGWDTTITTAVEMAQSAIAGTFVPWSH